MKRKGSSIIFINNNNEILLLLRDNIPTIPHPNMWDLPGGHVEENESPEECIIREMNEELNIILENFEPFSVDEFEDRIEYTFWKKVNLPFDFSSLINHLKPLKCHTNQDRHKYHRIELI